MAQTTVLEITQRVLSAIDSDNVSTIDETVESEQVFLLVKTVYDNLLDDFPWYHLRERGNLEVTSTAHIMKIPDNVTHVMELVIRYDGEKVYYKTPNEMTDLLNGRDTTLSTVDSNGAVNDTDPNYWTTYDDENIIFDSYDGTLVTSYTDCWFAVTPDKLTTGNDIPDLPEGLSSVLLWGVLEEAFRTLKGDETAASRYENKYRKGLAKAKRWARNINKKESTFGQDYGRKNIKLGNSVSSNYIIDGS